MAAPSRKRPDPDGNCPEANNAPRRVIPSPRAAQESSDFILSIITARGVPKASGARPYCKVNSTPETLGASLSAVSREVDYREDGFNCSSGLGARTLADAQTLQRCRDRPMNVGMGFFAKKFDKHRIIEPHRRLPEVAH